MKILKTIFFASFYLTMGLTQKDLRIPPSITRGPPRNRIYRADESVTLDCKGKGVPAVTYEWKKNNITLDQTLRNIKRGADGTITIQPATSSDEGFYQCFARNRYGTALSITAHVQMAFLDPTSGTPIIVLDRTVYAGQPFNITCNPRKSFPKATFSWKIVNSTEDKRPIALQLTNRIQIAENGKLVFGYALPKDDLDGKLYRCSTYNPYLRIEEGGNYTRLTVISQTVSPFAPTLGFSSKSPIVAVTGRNVTMTCLFNGNPEPTHIWLPPENAHPTGRYNLSDYNTTLTIEDVTASDEGQYICIATSSLGNNSKDFNINVEAEPMFPTVNDGPYDVNVIEGESFTFRCYSLAKPAAKIVWLQDGKELDPNNPPERFVFSKDLKNLTIRDVRRDCVDQERQTDLMVIQCNASNVHGYAFAQGYLNVLQRAKVTLLPNSSSELLDLAKENRFQFYCGATSDPSTPPTVRWYKVRDQGQELVYSEPPYVYVLDGNLTIILYNEPNCSAACDKYLGEYMCVGDNGYTGDTATVILNGITAYKPSERFVFSNDDKSLTIRDVCRDCFERDCNASNVHENVFAQGYLNVPMNDSGNPSESYCDNETDKVHSIVWKRTATGNETFQPCPINTTGWCSRRCLLKNDAIARWSRPNYNGCFDKEFSELLKTLWFTSCLANYMDETSQKNQTADIASQLAVLTNKSEGLSPGNLNASVMMINGLAVMRRRSKYSPNEKEIKSVIQAASNVLRTINSKAWEELEDVNKTVATDILFLFDVYGKSLSVRNISGRSTEEEDSLVLEAWSFEKSNLSLQIEFLSRSVWGEKRGDCISISMETLNSSISSESQSTLNMWGVYYRTIHDYLPGNKDIDVVNSRVLAFTIDGLTTNHTLNPPVLITLQHNQVKRTSFQRTCAFWNFDRGEWDSIGCSVTSTNSTHTICSCDHLTNFAILMSLNPSDDKLLPLLSIIGCSISVAALILTIIVYALTWKHSKSSRAAILLNLCVALITAYIILMAGGDKFKYELYSKDACTAVAVLLHYFFLAAFFIMLIEGVEMVLYMFFVFHVRRTRETILLIATAWVLPLIVVGVSLGYTKLEGYGHEKACWLDATNGLIWAFIGPVLCIITVNFVILILVLRLVSQKKDLLAQNRKKREEIRATIWNLSVTCPVLGLGWFFGVFSVAFDSVVFQYLFVIANTLQGLIIFIIYAIFYNKQMNEKISSVFSNYICRCRKTDTQTTSTQDQSTGSTAFTQMTSAQEQSTSSRATTQTSSAQDQSTCSIAANDSCEAIPMTPAQQQSTSSRAAAQMTYAQEQSTSSGAPTQMALAQEQSTISIAATQMTYAQEQSTVSTAATQMTSAQEQSTVSIAATQMTYAQEQSTVSIAATQMTSAQEQSTVSTAATQMTSAQEQSTVSIAATQMTSAQRQSTVSTAATQMTSAQEQSTVSTAATQMTSAQEQYTNSKAATQMTSAQEQSTSSGAANKKSYKTGFLGVPTAFKFCEEMGGQHNLKRTGTQLMSIVDSDTFDSSH